ncbi:MAG: hypothetical protein V3G42_00550 [Oscillospiraceae bacterium]
MGTQFWWFYDVLFLSIAMGILYHALWNGFRKEVLKTVGLALTITATFAVACFLSTPVYQTLFQEKITTTLQNALESEDFDIFETASESLALNATEGEETPDADGLRNIAEKIIAGEECPEWFIDSMGNATELLISRYVKPHSEKTLVQCFAGNIPAFQVFLQICETSPQDGAQILEALYYRQSYHKLVIMVLFLLLLLIMWVIISVIASMIEYEESPKPITGKSRIWAIPLGLTEAIGGLVMITVIIRLIVALTDGQMLLFNQETMNHTIIFRFVYRFIVKCLAI